MMVGQSIGHIKDIITCKELLKKMHDDAITCLRKASGLVQ
jgi:NAD(P)H-dependent flavin oxidoreductase YrpB (nitropropane dioxygenase family)